MEPHPNKANKTESWDGTSWTEVNDLNTARYELGLVWDTTQMHYSSLGFGQ